MIDAGNREDNVVEHVGQRDRILLKELLEPRQAMFGEGFERWRQVVVIFTGETRHEVRADVIRSACETLVLAYHAIAYTRRPAEQRA